MATSRCQSLVVDEAEAVGPACATDSHAIPRRKSATKIATTPSRRLILKVAFNWPRGVWDARPVLGNPSGARIPETAPRRRRARGLSLTTAARRSTARRRRASTARPHGRLGDWLRPLRATGRRYGGRGGHHEDCATATMLRAHRREPVPAR